MRPVAERPAAQQGHAERRPARSAAALINISGGIGDFGALRAGCTNRADSGRQWRPRHYERILTCSLLGAPSPATLYVGKSITA